MTEQDTFDNKLRRTPLKQTWELLKKHGGNIVSSIGVRPTQEDVEQFLAGHGWTLAAFEEALRSK